MAAVAFITALLWHSGSNVSQEGRGRDEGLLNCDILASPGQPEYTFWSHYMFIRKCMKIVKKICVEMELGSSLLG